MQKEPCFVSAENNAAEITTCVLFVFFTVGLNFVIYPELFYFPLRLDSRILIDLICI